MRRVIIRDEVGSTELFVVRALIPPLQGGVVWGRGPGAARSLAPGYFMSPLWGFEQVLQCGSCGTGEAENAFAYLK